MEKFREHMCAIHPTPTAHHSKTRIFILKKLYTCLYVYLRSSAVKLPLEPPYAEPHQVIKSLDDYRFIIEINGQEKTVSIDRLKPAYVLKQDAQEILTRGDQQIRTIEPNLSESIVEVPAKKQAKTYS